MHSPDVLRMKLSIFSQCSGSPVSLSPISSGPLEFVATEPTSYVEATGGVGTCTFDCRVLANSPGGTTGPSPIPCIHPHLIPNCSNVDGSRVGRSSTNCTRPRLNFCICTNVGKRWLYTLHYTKQDTIQYSLSGLTSCPTKDRRASWSRLSIYFRT